MSDLECKCFWWKVENNRFLLSSVAHTHTSALSFSSWPFTWSENGFSFLIQLTSDWSLVSKRVVGRSVGVVMVWVVSSLHTPKKRLLVKNASVFVLWLLFLSPGLVFSHLCLLLVWFNCFWSSLFRFRVTSFHRRRQSLLPPGHWSNLICCSSSWSPSWTCYFRMKSWDSQRHMNSNKMQTLIAAIDVKLCFIFCVFKLCEV